MTEVNGICRGCGSPELVEVIDLGLQPLANSLLTSEKEAANEARYPLTLVFCEKCGLCQLRETIAPDQLFSDYVYFSSVSSTMVDHARKLVSGTIERRGLNGQSLVVEAASNDGYLLQFYKQANIQVLGVEPAANIAKVAEEKRGVPTRVAFFDEVTASAMADEGCFADVFHAHNVLAHVPDPNRFLQGIATILKPNGIAIIEAPSLREMVDRLEFDTIYHEHYSYLSLSSVDTLARRNALVVVDVEFVDIHGGTLRYTLGHSGCEVSQRVVDMLEDERRADLLKRSYYERFEKDVSGLGSSLKTQLQDLRSAGRSIAVYGASAKGSTLLNAFGIGKDLVDYVVDRSPVKQGKLTPGTHLEVLNPDVLVERQPDYVLLLTWNFADEILAQQSAYRAAGGHFIIPVPTVQIV